MSDFANGSMDFAKAQRAIFSMLKAKGVPPKMAMDQAEDIFQNCAVDCLEKNIPLTYGILRIGVKHGAQKVMRSKERQSIYGKDGKQNIDAISRKDSTVGQVMLNDALNRLDPETELGVIGQMVCDGYKGFEIAEIMGVSTATISRRIEQVKEILDK